MSGTLERDSPCKVNLLLNILGRRPDGFHELETVMQPVGLRDRLQFSRGGTGIELTCSDPTLPTDSGNLVHRAAAAYLLAADLHESVRIHLEKRIPHAAGLGGGSGNAGVTLLAMNELFDSRLSPARLHEIAAKLGSDIPFFLQSSPALATGRGEQIESLTPFPALRGAAIVMIHPGFGIATAWAYKELAKYPDALNGRPGRARRLIELLQGEIPSAATEFYNSLEAPALAKYPLLNLYKEFLRQQGAAMALMSGSGSTIFGLTRQHAEASRLEKKVQAQFAPCWTAVASLDAFD